MAGFPFTGGLVPVNLGKAAAYSGGFDIYQTSVGQATTLFTGDAVALTANGFVNRASVATQDVLGVAVGFFWIDPVTKQPKESRYAPATTSSGAGTYNGINFGSNAGVGVKVITDMDQVYAIKARASVLQAKLGDKLEISYVSAGSAITGQSGAKASIAGVSADILRCVGVLKATELPFNTSTAGGTGVNDWGAAETVVLVKLSDTVEL